MFDHKGAGALIAVAIALGMSGAASAATPPMIDGLPSMTHAQQYNLSPASREIAPRSVLAATGNDLDFVQAGDTTSETTAHDLQVGTSTTTTTDGVTVRQAGVGDPGGWFGYTMSVGRSRWVDVRVEEAGDAGSEYTVDADGVAVYQRTAQPTQSGTYDNLDGVVHYQFALPASVLEQAPHNPDGTGRVVHLSFRNGQTPGDGAQIASVWTIARSGVPDGALGGTVSDPAAAFGGAGATFSSHILGRPYAIYDFGKEVGGQIQMTLDNTGAPMRLGLAFSESQMYMTTASDFSEDAPGVATETHYISVPRGVTHFTDPVIRGGFRYLMIFTDEPGTVQISDLRVHFTPAPTMTDPRDYKGAFLSANTTLNRLWYAGAYTVQTDTIDPSTGRDYPAAPGEVANNATIADGTTAITDGAKRDRLDWVGDQSVEDPVAYLTTGDTLSPLNSMTFMAKGAAADGQVPGVYLPGSGYNDGWGEYAEWWVREYWDYYLYTGDKAFLAQYYPTMAADVTWLESLVDANGLLDVDPASGTWGYAEGGEQTYDNALYVEVLKDAAQAATVEGDTPAAATDSSNGASVAAAINANLWDPSAGAYIVAAGDGAHPQDANVMALLSGVATGTRAGDVLSFLGTQLSPYGPIDIDQSGNVVGQYVSPFITYYELLAETEQNTTAATNEAMTMLDRTWDTMLDSGYSGDMWENVSLSGAPQLGAYTSLSHGWSAGVVPFLTNDILGVQPTTGGFETFSVLPHVPSSLPWAEGQVPTPEGAISAGWHEVGGTLTEQVSAPAHTSYTIGVPDSATMVTANGQVIWRDGTATAPGVSDGGGYIELAGATGTTKLVAR